MGTSASASIHYVECIQALDTEKGAKHDQVYRTGLCRCSLRPRGAGSAASSRSDRRLIPQTRRDDHEGKARISPRIRAFYVVQKLMGGAETFRIRPSTAARRDISS